MLKQLSEIEPLCVILLRLKQILLGLAARNYRNSIDTRYFRVFDDIFIIKTFSVRGGQRQEVGRGRSTRMTNSFRRYVMRLLISLHFD